MAAGPRRQDRLRGVQGSRDNFWRASKFWQASMNALDARRPGMSLARCCRWFQDYAVCFTCTQRHGVGEGAHAKPTRLYSPRCWMTRQYVGRPAEARAKCRRSLRWYLSGGAYRPQTLETWRQSGIDNGLCRLVPFSLPAVLANMLANSTVADAAPASRRPSSCFNRHPGRPCICVQRGAAYNFSLFALGATAALLSAVRGAHYTVLDYLSVFWLLGGCRRP